MRISLNINLKKIDESLLFEGAKGSYLNANIVPNREGEDRYGNAGFIAQDPGREKREAGVKGPIIGNYKVFGDKTDAPARRQESQPPRRQSTSRTDAPPVSDMPWDDPEDDGPPF